MRGRNPQLKLLLVDFWALYRRVTGYLAANWDRFPVCKLWFLSQCTYFKIENLVFCGADCK